MERGRFRRRQRVGGDPQEEEGLGLAENKIGTSGHRLYTGTGYRESGSSSKASVLSTGSGQRLAPQWLWLMRIQVMGMPLDR